MENFGYSSQFMGIMPTIWFCVFFIYSETNEREFSIMYNFANDWRMKHIEADLCSLLRYHSAAFYRVMGLFPRKDIHYKISTTCNNLR